jgi:chromosome segregation ATPase
MAPIANSLIARLTGTIQNERETAEKNWSKMRLVESVPEAAAREAMRVLGKSLEDLKSAIADADNRKAWCEQIARIPELQSEADKHSSAQRKLIEDLHRFQRETEAKLGEERRAESLANSELQVALRAKQSLIAGRPEFARRIAELREAIGNARNRMSDLQPAIKTAEDGLRLCREFMKRPGKPITEKELYQANSLFGTQNLPGLVVSVPAERVREVFDNLTISLANNKTELATCEATIAASEKELSKLEAAQLEP